MDKFEGELEEKSEVKETSKAGNYRIGLKIGGRWFGIFGNEKELLDIDKEAVIGRTAHGTYVKSGQYLNIEDVQFKDGGGNPEDGRREAKTAEGIMEQQRQNRISNMVDCLVDAGETWRRWKYPEAEGAVFSDEDERNIRAIAISFRLDNRQRGY